MDTEDPPPRQPITIAQAWSAPLVACLLGIGFAVWGAREKPEAAWVTATLIIMIAGPAACTALIARGLVGIYRKHHGAGIAAVIAGVLLFGALAVGLSRLPNEGESPPGW